MELDIGGLQILCGRLKKRESGKLGLIYFGLFAFKQKLNMFKFCPFRGCTIIIEISTKFYAQSFPNILNAFDLIEKCHSTWNVSNHRPDSIAWWLRIWWLFLSLVFILGAYSLLFLYTMFSLGLAKAEWHITAIFKELFPASNLSR